MPSDAENIIEPLSPSEVVGQAIDVLMASNALSRDAAVDLLIQHAADSHLKVLESAADIIEERRGG